MLTNQLFTLIPRLMRSRWVRRYRDHHGACETAVEARLGPLHLMTSHCFVLDHEDAAVGLSLPTLHWVDGRLRRGHIQLCYRVCRGSEPVRPAGWECIWWRPGPTVVYGRSQESDDPIPF